jgi:NAD(P)-dependent dehydrogenase (short-subunit alcohol dehydrogenase family)
MPNEARVALITGCGKPIGIGNSTARALAAAGVTVVVSDVSAAGVANEHNVQGDMDPGWTGVESLVRAIVDAGGTASATLGDVSVEADAARMVEDVLRRHGRLDILVNNAGLNILDRHWDKLTPEGIDQLVNGNLTQALYCVTVALPMMRAQKDGLLIHTASMAGRFIGGFSGPIYGAAKHGVVAMSHTINQQECINGIRSTVFLPGEVATPILDKRPNPVGPEERARMVQSEDCGDLIRYIACMPRHLVMSEVMLAPTWNRTYIANLQQKL